MTHTENYTYLHTLSLHDALPISGSDRRPRRSLRAGTSATRPGAGVMTDASGHAAVSLRQVDKYYGAYHALRSIDLEIAPRERIVICGSSGSGKSTLIRCMNRLEVPDAGGVLIEGDKITDASREALGALRAVGVVFQQFNLFPPKPVLEHCTLPPVLLRR